MSGLRLAAAAASNQWQPSDHGLLAWSAPPEIGAINNIAPAANGRVIYVRLKLRAAAPVTNVILGVNSAGSGLTAGQNFAGLFQGGVLLGSTADQTTNWGTAGVQIMPLVGGPFACVAGDIFVGFFANAATSRPSFNIGGAVALANVNLGAAVKYGFNAAGATTAMPGTVLALTPDNDAWWAAVS